MPGMDTTAEKILDRQRHRLRRLVDRYGTQKEVAGAVTAETDLSRSWVLKIIASEITNPSVKNLDTLRRRLDEIEDNIIRRSRPWAA